MSIHFKTQVYQEEGKNATGIEVPPAVMEELGAGKKPAVKVTVNKYIYRSTVAVMGGRFMIPLSSEHRQAAGVHGGQVVDVALELDNEPRTVDIPSDLLEALAEGGVMEQFERTAFSMRKEYVRQVESAKAAETRTRRIAAIVEKLS
jgi:hypothetical protein